MDMPKYQALDRIPNDLKILKQWLVSREDKIPLTTVNNKDLFRADVTNPLQLLDFNSAKTIAQLYNLDIGFVLCASDEFTCIDLDVKDVENEANPDKRTTQDDYNRFWRVIQEFKSYTEFSRSTKGIHIWVKGTIGAGMRRDKVEVYSQERYIICTGNILNNLPIINRQETLDTMQKEMRRNDNKTELSDIEQTLEDWDIVEIAMAASNADKFNQLCAGDWVAMGYPSQSEADMALMSMFTFYSQSNEQCRRLFRFTKLGERDKAVKNDVYLNRTLSLIRGREENETLLLTSQEELAAKLVQQLQNERPQTEFLHSPENTDDSIYVAPAASTFAQLTEVPSPPVDGLDWPPGYAGVIARYIYNSAPRPVKEVAIVAALGLLAGICGKVWSITQSGLNMYIILIARSGVGKEAMHSGISSLITAVASREPCAMNFVNFSEFVSGPALIKAIASNQSFVNVAGEFGKRLTRLANDNGKDSAMQSLRTVMTDLYQKSGPMSIVGGLMYSTKENNIAAVSGVAYSMIGETTPGTFYDCLTTGMMSDGFLSRFNIVEYDGERPPMNLNQLMVPDKALGDSLSELCSHATNMIRDKKTISVGRSQRSAEIIAAFEKECDDKINGSQDESYRQMWNRAALKVIKMAALLSVADNYLFPVIQEHHLDWALKLVRLDIGIMKGKAESGDIGMGDGTREKKVISLMTDYLRNNVRGNYHIDVPMQNAGIISRRYLQQRTASISSFEKYHRGSSAALNDTLKSLIDSGYIVECLPSELVSKYKFHGKAYRIIAIK